MCVSILWVFFPLSLLLYFFCCYCLCFCCCCCCFCHLFVFNALLWRLDFGFAIANYTQNRIDSIVRRMRNAQNRFVFRFSSTFALCLCVFIYISFADWIADDFVFSLPVCLSVRWVCLGEFLLLLSSFLFAYLKNRCVRIDRRQFAWTHLQNFCWHEYIPIFATLFFIVLRHFFYQYFSLSLFPVLLSLTFSFCTLYV